jgi:hypothetical protein
LGLDIGAEAGMSRVVDFSEQKDRLDPLLEMRRRANGHNQNNLNRPLLSILLLLAATTIDNGLPLHAEKLQRRRK